MNSGKPSLAFSTRLQQFLCKHHYGGKTAFKQGVNLKEGELLVMYSCGKCEHCFSVWEKKEDC